MGGSVFAGKTKSRMSRCIPAKFTGENGKKRGSPLSVSMCHSRLLSDKSLQRRKKSCKWKCTHCRYSTKHKKDLNKHSRIHSGEKPFECASCEFATGDISVLYYHIDTKHHNARQFKCTLCDKAFDRRIKLHRHSREHMDKAASRRNTIASPFLNPKVLLNCIDKALYNLPAQTAQSAKLSMDDPVESSFTGSSLPIVERGLSCDFISNRQRMAHGAAEKTRHHTDAVASRVNAISSSTLNPQVLLNRIDKTSYNVPVQTPQPAKCSMEASSADQDGPVESLLTGSSIPFVDHSLLSDFILNRQSMANGAAEKTRHHTDTVASRVNAISSCTLNPQVLLNRIDKTSYNVPVQTAQPAKCSMEARSADQDGPVDSLLTGSSPCSPPFVHRGLSLGFVSNCQGIVNGASEIKKGHTDTALNPQVLLNRIDKTLYANNVPTHTNQPPKCFTEARSTDQDDLIEGSLLNPSVPFVHADVDHDPSSVFLSDLQCTVCAKVFDSETDLCRHLCEVHIGTRLKMHPHSLAGTQTLKLTKQQKNEVRNKMYQKVTDKYRRRQTLRLHCLVCDYSTTVESHLDRHFLIHTGEKPFRCSYCDYATRDQSRLYGHIGHTHPGRKQFECTMCDKAFDTRIKLKHHLKTPD